MMQVWSQYYLYCRLIPVFLVHVRCTTAQSYGMALESVRTETLMYSVHDLVWC